MSDYDRVKAWREKNRKECPGGCSNTIAWNSRFCRSCAAKAKRDKALDRTVAEVKAQSNSLRWSDHIRYFAREMHKFDKCAVCGYDKFVHVAHIIDICKWSNESSIREINSKNNVVGLCPNHHAEFDEGLLNPKDIPGVDIVALTKKNNVWISPESINASVSPLASNQSLKA